MQLLNIAEGQQLMYLIGSGHERDKCEAVRHWVQQAVADLAPEQGYPLLADLMMKLEKELLGKGVGTRD